MDSRLYSVGKPVMTQRDKWLLNCILFVWGNDASSRKMWLLIASFEGMKDKTLECLLFKILLFIMLRHGLAYVTCQKQVALELG